MSSSPLTEAHLNAISDVLRPGNKIDPIRLHRTATEMGLWQITPDQFPANAQSKRCWALWT